MARSSGGSSGVLLVIQLSKIFVSVVYQFQGETYVDCTILDACKRKQQPYRPNKLLFNHLNYFLLTLLKIIF